MSHLAFLYLRTVLQEQGPLTAAGAARILTEFTPDQIDRIVAWGVNNGSLIVEDDLLYLTERGAR